MREKSKRLKTGRLSWRIATTAGPDMKSPSTSTTKTPSLGGPLAGFIGAACPCSGGDIAFRALRAQYGAPEVPFALDSPSRRTPRCRTVAFPAFMSPEIGTKLAPHLTFLSPHPERSGLLCLWADPPDNLHTIYTPSDQKTKRGQAIWPNPLKLLVPKRGLEPRQAYAH
jgi:hypothetical protein